MKKIREVKFYGKTVDIVDKIDWSGNTVIVCGDKSYFKNDVKGSCSICDKVIYWRLYQPIDVKKICLGCVSKIN